MKSLIFSLLAAVFVSAASHAQTFKISLEGFEKISNVEVVKVRVAYPSTDKTYALWQSADMKTWSRTELEYGKTAVMQVDSNMMPLYDYYVRKNRSGFFKIAPYIPKGFIFTRDLTLGSTGEDVANLQTFLQETGYMQWWPDMEKGYFGNMTQSALAYYQSSVGIFPMTGYLGPLTRASINARLD